MAAETAEVVALQAVAYLAADETRWRTLLVQTGVDGTVLRSRLGEAAVLGEIVAFLMSHEKWAAEFCRDVGGDSQLLWRTQRALERAAGSR